MTTPTPLRIAMWSGPRNISTAMMRSWENRADTAVVDEPFYAVYLAATGIDHPGRDEVIAAQETDWRRVVAMLTGPVPGDRPIFYQKHMTHHMLPAIDTGWLAGMANVFLIRDPRAVIASYVRKREAVTLEDIGLRRQVELFEQVARQSGKPPLVIDADDVLTDPAGALAGLCRSLRIDFDLSMLSWPPGPRHSDGVWSKHWYQAVERSTGFQRRDTAVPSLPAGLEDLVEASAPYYRILKAHCHSVPSNARDRSVANIQIDT